MNIDFVDTVVTCTPLELSNKLKDRTINTVRNCADALERLIRSRDGNADQTKLDKMLILVNSQPTIINRYNTSGFAPIHMACLLAPLYSYSENIEDYKKSTTILNFLITQGANVNLEANNYLKNAPLHIACMNQNFDIVRCLIENKAIVDITNIDYQTPLFYSLQSSKIVKLLLDSMADRNHIDYNGNTVINMWENNLAQYGDRFIESKNIILNFNPN
jgi:ankyrin repeat protein